MIKKLLSLSTSAIFAIAVLLTVALTTLSGAKEYMAVKSARDNGQLTEVVLTDKDFRLESMRSRAPQEGWKATDGDPQLIYSSQMLFTSLEFYMEYSVYPGEMLLYYSTRQDGVYSNDKMAVITPIKGKEGWFGVSIPMTEISSIRIDPTVTAGNHMVFGDFVINSQTQLADYMAFDGYTMLSVIIYSLVLFAIFSFIKDFFTKFSK